MIRARVTLAVFSFVLVTALSDGGRRRSLYEPVVRRSGQELAALSGGFTPEPPERG